jgi:four helix bundle protein
MGHRAERQEVNIEPRELRRESRMAKFRFQDLEIWQMAIEIGCELFDIADDLEAKRFYRFAEQLRGSGMSMSNNIAEGSGSSSKKEFVQFLNIARRSTFENANILILLNKRNLVSSNQVELQLDGLDHLCRMISNFQKTLKLKER